MQIEWKSNTADPYVFRQVAEWPGLRVHRAHVHAGKMLEHVNDCHEVNVALSGALTTRKVNSIGRQIVNSTRGNNLCITPAGQPISAEWTGKLDNLGMFLNAGFVSQTAVENGFSPNVEFVELYKKQDPLIQNIGLTLLETATKDDPMGNLFAESLIQTLTFHVLTNYTNAGVTPTVSAGGLA
ncbi:MAG: hypothetical protein ABL984_15360, partial [Pyrinomonadaceae bacterium]